MSRLALWFSLAACGASSPAGSTSTPVPTTMVGTGHPYWKQLAIEARASFAPGPDVAASVTPEGCVRLTADGTIVDIKLVHASKQPAIDDAALRALDAVKRARAAKPIAVPAELRSTLAGWVCFRFEPADDALNDPS